jgi:hypothetical protein
MSNICWPRSYYDSGRKSIMEIFTPNYVMWWPSEVIHLQKGRFCATIWHIDLWSRLRFATEHMQIWCPICREPYITSWYYTSQMGHVIDSLLDWFVFAMYSSPSMCLTHTVSDHSLSFRVLFIPVMTMSQQLYGTTSRSERTMDRWYMI